MSPSSLGGMTGKSAAAGDNQPGFSSGIFGSPAGNVGSVASNMGTLTGGGLGGYQQQNQIMPPPRPAPRPSPSLWDVNPLGTGGYGNPYVPIHGAPGYQFNSPDGITQPLRRPAQQPAPVPAGPKYDWRTAASGNYNNWGNAIKGVGNVASFAPGIGIAGRMGALVAGSAIGNSMNAPVTDAAGTEPDSYWYNPERFTREMRSSAGKSEGVGGAMARTLGSLASRPILTLINGVPSVWNELTKTWNESG